MIDVIVIVEMQTPVQDLRANRGVTEKIKSPSYIKEYLNTLDWFTDDEVFVDEKFNKYSIDDLIGKTVKVKGGEPFVVEE